MALFIVVLVIVMAVLVISIIWMALPVAVAIVATLLRMA